MVRGLFRWLPAASLCLILAAGATHAARTEVHVPDDLEQWVGWVLEDKEYLDCPFFFDRGESNRDVFICAWPGELAVEADRGGASFRQPWTVYAGEQWIPLPGDGDLWPEQVTVNGQAVQVVLQDNRPSVRLGPGNYTLAGRFSWEQRPRVLPVPPETGLLALTVEGRPVARPERTPTSVWLAEREPQARAEDSIDVQAYRLVEDDVPTRLTSRFIIDVAGSVREVTLAPVLPDGFVPLALESPLPARLEQDGSLRLQVRPGTWRLRLEARANGVVDAIALPEPANNLPDVEIWSFRSNDRLRVTVPEGLAPVDPAQVSVPGEWASLPAFRVEPAGTLRLVEQGRGIAAVENQLALQRELWMDFDGDGFVFSDSIGGLMRSDWRLDMVLPYRLLSAKEHGQNLLVTLGAEETLSGVELRRRAVDLQALGRTETTGTLPVTGWQTSFEDVRATLNLPPGNKLFGAWGADRAPQSWLQRWKLLDFFLVLIVTIAVSRLFGRNEAVIALLALSLSWHESGAPQWIWLNLLAAIALVRVAPEGRLKNTASLYRSLSLGVLVLVLVPFFAAQLRIAIYPQLEPQWGGGFSMDVASPGAASKVAAEAELMTRQAVPPVEEAVVSAARARQSFARYAPNAIVQAGPGKPSWSWNRYALEWSGPVAPERDLTLLVMPRWLVTVLRFAEVLLLLSLAAVFASEIFRRAWPWPRRGGGVAAASAPTLLCAILAASALVPGGAAEAQTPSPEILQQLEQRLLEPPPCAPRCAEIAAAEVEVGSGSMTIALLVHAQEEVAVALPGSLDGWRPELVEVNGRASNVYRRGDQTLWVRAASGSSRVLLRGPLPPVQSLEVPFPAPPRIITARSDSWSIAGIRDRRLLSGSLQLARLRADSGNESAVRWDSSRFPTFVRIERTIEMDLDWRVHTQVTRIAPGDGALALEVPLVEGESIVSGDFRVEDGEVLVSMGPNQRVVAWQSTLPRTSPLTLRAAAGAPYKEVWRVAIGGIWRVLFDGVPESEAESPADEARVAEFYPRGGESLTLTAERPEALSGTTLAFDSVRVHTAVGARSRETSMSLGYRSTRGAQHVIVLPPVAEVLSVSIDGRNESLRANEGRLSLPILPGEHRIDVQWREQGPVTARSQTPAVDLAAAAGNIELGMQLPVNRWILATSGPRLGPAVMYWSELAALVLFAFILGRVSLTPLGTREWLLLGLGFSTFSWPALMLVAGWLLTVGARRRWTGTTSWWRFDLVQVVIAAISIAALFAIVATVPGGLLGQPDMHVTGNGSYGNSLRWFADRSAAALPQASALSVPMWVYKVLILAWALWLSFALLRWLPWAWASFVSQGLWRPRSAAAA